MRETFILIMLLVVCGVDSNVTSTCTQEDICHSYLDVAMDMISKAKYNIPTCRNYTKIELKKPADCSDVLDMGHNKSGVYEIWPMNKIMDGKSAFVYCDMDTDGGGWTVIQRRGDFGNPKDYFYRNWENYKEGFGNIKQDFWLGNDKIFALTNQKVYAARFDLKDVEKNKRYAVYDKFWIDDEERMYTLHISLYSGDAGDSMEYQNSFKFVTFDRENVHNCSKENKGGWWYNWCHRANLNGIYYKGKYKNTYYDGICWKAWKGYEESLLWTEMKVRPKYFRHGFA